MKTKLNIFEILEPLKEASAEDIAVVLNYLVSDLNTRSNDMRSHVLQEERIANRNEYFEYQNMQQLIKILNLAVTMIKINLDIKERMENNEL